MFTLILVYEHYKAHNVPGLNKVVSNWGEINK